MDGTEEALARRLERMSYRQVQQMAKSLKLPSNFKKIYLAQLIITRKFKTEEEVASIISRVKEERRYQSQLKKSIKEKMLKVTENKRLALLAWAGNNFTGKMDKTMQDNNQNVLTRKNKSVIYSPPITETPKRSSNAAEYSPEILRQALTSINPKRNILRVVGKDHNSNIILVKDDNIKTERTLHNYNLRTPKPNYALVNNIKDESFSNTDTKIKFVASKSVQQFNVQTKCYVHKKNVFKQEFLVAHTGEYTENIKPATRKRTISGISPITPKENPPLNLATNEVVRFRNTDGSYTKINAVVTKNSNMPKKNYSTRVQKINIQDIMDCMDIAPQNGVSRAQNDNYYSKTHHPNAGLHLGMSGSNIDVSTHKSITNRPGKAYCKPSGSSSFNAQPAQYGDSFRADQLRCYEQMIPTPPRNNVVQPCYPKARDCRVKLPRFSEAFKRCRNGYVQVDSEPENVPTYPDYINQNNKSTPMLETLYNLKTPSPLPTKTFSLPTKFADTQCIYTLGTVSTTAMFPITKTVSSSNALNVTPRILLDNYQYRCNEGTLITDYLQPEQSSVQSTDVTPGVLTDNYQYSCDGVESLISDYLQPLQSSYEQSTDITAGVLSDSYQFRCDVETCITDYLPVQTGCGHNADFIPDAEDPSVRMDDLMEIISQDGDYMERMGVATPVQCVLCPWSGPVLMLETHVRQKHTDTTHRLNKSEWNITYTLESLVLCKVWLHRVIEHDSTFYMLSAKYEEPRSFMVTLSSISVFAEPAGQAERVSITLYNKITGEPFTWIGQISPASALNSPSAYSHNCFKIDLAKLGLLPYDNTSSKSFNGSFSESPTNVMDFAILNNVHITVYVKVYNSPPTTM